MEVWCQIYSISQNGTKEVKILSVNVFHITGKQKKTRKYEKQVGAELCQAPSSLS